MHTQTPEITLETYAATRDQGVTIDVREPMEFVAGHLPGTLPIPMGQLAARMGELDRTRPVFVICATGNRSLAMADLLRAGGFDARSVAQGTEGWLRSGRKVVRGR